MFKNQKITIDLRWVSLALLSLSLALLVMQKPWDQSVSADRTITVTGEATVEAEPDTYQFNPTYQKRGSDRSAIQQELVVKVNEVIEELKTLGVDESDITLYSATYDMYWRDGDQEVTSNSIQVSVKDRELATKVQDYLLSTAPEGQISPYVTFSTGLRNSLKDQIRSEAIADAKRKAEASANELEARLGKVITITDQTDMGGIMPFMDSRMSSAVSELDKVDMSLPVMPGKQEISYSVSVVYQIR